MPIHLKLAKEINTSGSTILYAVTNRQYKYHVQQIKNLILEICYLIRLPFENIKSCRIMKTINENNIAPV